MGFSMSDVMENAMREIASTEGVLACALRFSDTRKLSFSSHVELEPGRLDSIWNHLAETVKAFSLRRFPVSRLRWRFGKCHLGWFVREDGIAMGIIVEPSVQHSLGTLESWFHALIQEGQEKKTPGLG